MKHPVTIFCNGQEHAVAVEPGTSLLRVLRDDLHLTGTKEGCGTGYCGACTVIVDDACVNSCLYFAVDADHRAVTTVEGLAGDGPLHALQAAFVNRGALQCGFCTPGMLLAATALLREHDDPTEADIRRALAGNLCRCTGYAPIVAAVIDAAAHLRDEKASGGGPNRAASVRSRA